MRFSNTVLLGALPLLVAAEQQQSPIDDLKVKGRYYWDRLQSYFPSVPSPNFVQPDTENSPPAATDTSSTSSQKPLPAIETVTIDTWQNILHSTPATSTKSADATTEDWFLLLTGGNKTCYGLCSKVETSFNESAALFALEPTHPNLALLNCDAEPILCNSWAAGPPSLYIFSIPSITQLDAKTPLYIHSLNTTTTTPETYVELWKTGSYKEGGVYEGYFHPVDGPLAKFGAAIPLGYVLWGFSLVPSWVFMIGVSFISRTMMSRKMAPKPRTAPAAGAPPGDAR